MKKNIIFAASCAALLIYSCDNKKVEEKVSEVKDTIKTEVNHEMDKMEADKDKKFIQEAAQDGNLEVQLGKLVKEKATSKDVKSYAKMLVAQHESANADLKSLAAAKGITIEDSLNDTGKNRIKEFKGLNGKELDKKYIAGMVEDHKKDIDKFQERADKTKDTELKEWIDKTLPHLKHHLEDAQKIDSTLNRTKK